MTLFNQSQKNNEKRVKGGYIVVVVLLLSAVLLMLGLSMAARTTEEVFLTSQEQDSARVFNAAESGAEEALYKLETGEATVTTSAPTNISVTSELNDSNINVTGELLSTLDNYVLNEGATLTIPYNGQAPVLKWNNGEDCNQGQGALLITLYHKPNNSSPFEAYHVGLKKKTPSSESCWSDFTATQELAYNADTTLDGSLFGSVTLSNDDFFRVTALYNNVTFSSITNGGFQKIVSTANDRNDGAGQGSETRTVEIIRSHPGYAGIFDYALFSGGNIVK